MSAVSSDHLDLIHQIQGFATLEDSFLAGGTNLALRYNHRKSVDIDLFIDHHIGRIGFEEIRFEFEEFFDGKLLKFQYPSDEDDDLIFSRALILKNGNAIKVEVLQCMQHVDEIEELNGLRVASLRDIGLYKLIAAAQRMAQKDIYDLDYITDEFPLAGLMEALEVKMQHQDEVGIRSIFDIVNPVNPVANPELLVGFDASVKVDHLPKHGAERIHVVDGKPWLVARSSWRFKVREYFNIIGSEFPGQKHIDL